jgi:hypothetical protein
MTNSIIIIDTTNGSNYTKNVDISAQLPKDASKAYVCIDGFQAFIRNATFEPLPPPGSIGINISSATNCLKNVENYVYNTQLAAVFSSMQYTPGNLASNGTQFSNLFFNGNNNIENWIELSDFKQFKISFELHPAFSTTSFVASNFQFVLSLRVKYE